jgi:hypothetical protein
VKKLIIVATLALAFGMALGSMWSRQATQRHGHQLAVMWLAQFHLQSLHSAVQTNDCVVAGRSVAHLHSLADEIALAFPKADAQDKEFHARIEQLREATQLTVGPASSCAVDAPLLSKIEGACDNCHRDYR